MTVEVCPICDIAGCKHIREKTHPMTHDTPPKRITLEEAQAAVDPRLVAEILRDFGTNFDGVYPVGVLARGVGPEQSMIGLAIKRGHLVTRSHADAMVAAALRPDAAEILAKEMQMIVAADRWKGRDLHSAPPEKWHKLRPETQQFWIDEATRILKRLDDEEYRQKVAQMKEDFPNGI